jgi:hypothetical protein
MKKNNSTSCIVLIAVVMFVSGKLFSYNPVDTTVIKPITDSLKPASIKDTTGNGPKLKLKESGKDTIGPSGVIEPGAGHTLINTKYLSMNITCYGLFRYINQLPPNQTYVDHTGQTRLIDARNDFQLHRVVITLKGFMYHPKLRYTFILWCLNSTNNVNILGTVGYLFSKQFTITAGIGSLQGTRTLHYSHPLWLGTDRVMADDFFRPGFTTAIWIQGEALPGFHYSAMVGNSLSQVGIKAAQLTRDLAKCVSIWWLPTTKEFGPLQGFSDYEHHDKVATTFGTSYTQSVEDRYSQTTNFPDNTQTRLSDATLPFEINALAPGVTLQSMNFQLVSVNGGMKYKGFFLQTEFYYRMLNDFKTDGPISMSKIIDRGFYVQASYFVIKKRLELYGLTSQIFGAFNYSNEYGFGFNIYPFPTRLFRLNGQANIVYKSAANSTFGYYVGGLQGTILSFSSTINF